MSQPLRIGTRDSELAVWQATLVKNLLAETGVESELVFIKSEGDKDLITPLYEIGVQGIFTRSLDIALLNNHIDIAVHSMKDVPTNLPHGLQQAAVLKRADYKDIFVPSPHIEKGDPEFIDSLRPGRMNNFLSEHTVATSSIRRKAQWLYRYPNHTLESIRGNVNTRLQKTADSDWAGTIFAAAGLERINKKPGNAVVLEWMQPAPAQGAIVVIIREDELDLKKICAKINDENTSICTRIEKDFLRELRGGCTSPISALAQITNNDIYAIGSVFSVDGKQKVAVQKMAALTHASSLGKLMAREILENGANEILETIWAQRTV